MTKLTDERDVKTSMGEYANTNRFPQHGRKQELLFA